MAEAIGSALAQSYSNKEVIVIDDGSTDRSLTIIRGFERLISWRTGPTRGGGVARNHGWQMSCGEYIKFLDSDDFLLPGCIRQQVQAAAALQANQFPVGRMYRLEEHTGKILPHANRDAAEIRDQSLLPMLTDAPPMSAPLFRRRALIEIGGFAEELSIRQDFDLFIRLILAGHIPMLTAESTYVYRDHSDPMRVSRQRGFKKAEEQLAMFKRHVELLERSPALDMKDIIAEGIAISIWKTGRNVLREGYHALAREYFLLATCCHPRRQVCGRRPYRIMNRAFGPILTEHILEGLKGTKRKRE